LAVLFFVLIVGWYIAIASEFSWIAANVSHSALFYQNFTLMKEGDYFGVSSQNNPLLHIWSLSIEEQFYIIFPFFCFLIWKIGKKSTFCLGVFVVGLTILSFLLCLTISDQVVRFYLPFSRFWELGVGICVAYIEIFSGVTARRYGEGLLNGLSVFGFGLILLAFFLPSSLYSSPPGFFSLIPVVGSALLILSNANSLINRSILSWSWVTFIGLISYSLYLWFEFFLVSQVISSCCLLCFVPCRFLF
jgi:peptidoglycan/LPS O-acetylase OafA/YrhL